MAQKIMYVIEITRTSGTKLDHVIKESRENRVSPRKWINDNMRIGDTAKIQTYELQKTECFLASVTEVIGDCSDSE